MKHTVAFATLGCRLNQADTALLSNRFQKLDFDVIELNGGVEPDVIVVNTCAVTSTAVAKSRQMLKSLRTHHPNAFIVATGCAAQVENAKFVAMPACNIALTNPQKKDIASILAQHLDYLGKKTAPAADDGKSLVFLERANAVYPYKTRGTLKVQEGCENFCSYCIVPYARGPERSRDAEETMRDFTQMVAAGHREIIISGVNVCNYNCRGLDLIGLLERLILVPGDYRLRISSTEPGPIVPALVDFIAKHPDKICPFLHLPLQSGSNAVLKAMNRHYSAEEFLHMVQYARNVLPDIHLGTDLIVGFPGETPQLFSETCAFLETARFSNIHIFPFSPRKGTPAEKMPGRIVGAELDDRLERVRGIKEQSASAYLSSVLGKTETVLVEEKNGDFCEGWSGNYIRTVFRAPDVQPHEFACVRFKSLSGDHTLSADLDMD